MSSFSEKCQTYLPSDEKTGHSHQLELLSPYRHPGEEPKQQTGFSQKYTTNDNQRILNP